MEKISIGQIINMNAIRYDRMTQIVSTAFTGSNATKVNIYIDLFNMIKTLYRDYNYVIDDYSDITSCIINICAHYRSFFEERYHVSSEIFLVFSTNTCSINKALVDKYNSKTELMIMSNPKVTDMIDNNLKLLEILCPYLPDIYFIRTEYETSVAIKYLIDKRKDISPNIVVTKDIYNYQLAADMMNNVTIFRPSKAIINSQTIDNSYFINHYNLFDTFLMERKNNYKSTMDLYTAHLPIIMALSRVPERNIKSLLNINVSINILSKMIEEHYIGSARVSDIEYVYEYIANNVRTDIHGQLFLNRYKAIDIPSQLNILLTDSSSCLSIENGLINLYDPVAVQQINNEYFKHNPLDLNRL